MFRLRNYAIPKRLPWRDMLAIATVLGLACATFIAYDLSNVREHMERDLAMKAQMVAANSVSALATDNAQAVEKTLSALREAPEIVGAGVYTEDGRRFAAYWSDRRKTLAALPAIPARQDHPHWVRDGKIALMRPILSDGKPVGTVYIESDLGELTERLKTYLILAAVVLLTCMLAVLMISSIFQRAIADPIANLAETARIVSQEKVYTVRARSSAPQGELAVLINTFNEMLGQIEEREAALQSEIAGRKHAQEELYTSQSRLSGIIGSAMDSIITTDSEQHIVLFNSAAEKMFGCAAGEALGQSIERFIPKRFRGNHAGHIRKFADTRVTGRAMGAMGALWAVRANGEEFQIEASISQVEAAGKKLFTVILRDITERKQAEEALREQARVLDLAQVLVRDMQGRIGLWNGGAEKLYGYTQAEALGRTSHELLQTKFPEPLAEIEKILYETGTWEGELIHRKRDDGVLAVASIWVLHRDAEGQPLRVLEMNTDITARKEAARQLAWQAEELSFQAAELARSRTAFEDQSLMLRSVLDGMDEGLVAVDEQGNFMIWNPAAARIVGMGSAKVPPEEWSTHYGLYMPDMITPFPAEQNPLALAIRGEPGSAVFFLRNPNLEQGVWVEATGSPLRDGRGVLHGGVVAFRDITQKRMAEQEIRKLNEELEGRVIERTAQLQAANKELEAFTYSVSHDLRAPLRHILGFSRILAEEFGPSLPAEAQRHLNRIQDGTRRMGQLVDELLSLARVGRQPVKREPTALDALVQDVVQILEPETQQRKVEWKIQALPEMECDPVLVRQVFQNLIANALKYTRPRSPAVIEIGQTEQAGERVFFIRDNGVGFSMKHADKLFGVFQRLHRQEEFEGTGVGLATVQRIVLKHGGRVWAEAEVEKGATFYFTLGGVEGVPCAGKETPSNENQVKAAAQGVPS